MSIASRADAELRQHGNSYGVELQFVREGERSTDGVLLAANLSSACGKLLIAPT